MSLIARTPSPSLDERLTRLGMDEVTRRRTLDTVSDWLTDNNAPDTLKVEVVDSKLDDE